MLKKTLRFLSSVKLAIVLFILIAVMSIIGTLIPQQRSAGQYSAQYGIFAPLLMKLRLNDLYHSVWYLGLLSFFALNTMVCTLSRFPAKWKRAGRSRFVADEKALSQLPIKERWKSQVSLSQAAERLQGALKSRGYKVRKSSEGARVHLLGKKRTSGHFGSDIVHLGLLIILLGGILSGWGGFRAELPLSEGETAPVPESSFSLRLDKFTTEYYPGGGVKDWKSALTVLENGSPVLSKTVEVNHPLTYKGFSFYQMSVGFEWDRPRLEFLVKKKDDPEFAKTFLLRPGERTALDDGEGTEIGVLRFLPDFVLNSRNEPQTRSLQPNNPAALIEGWRGGKRIFQGWTFANYPDFGQMHGEEETDLGFQLTGLDAPQYSVLEVARDPGVPLIWIGCILLMGGLGLAFYWPPREIRAVLEESQGRAEIAAGGIGAKSRDRFRTEFETIIAEARRAK